MESRCFQLECQVQTELFVVCSGIYSSLICLCCCVPGLSQFTCPMLCYQFYSRPSLISGVHGQSSGHGLRLKDKDQGFYTSGLPVLVEQSIMSGPLLTQVFRDYITFALLFYRLYFLLSPTYIICPNSESIPHY